MINYKDVTYCRAVTVSMAMTDNRTVNNFREMTECRRGTNIRTMTDNRAVTDGRVVTASVAVIDSQSFN